MDASPKLSQLIRAVERRAPAGTALERLGAAVELSDELWRLGDRLIDRHVQDARSAGHSWNEIGRTLGVSKQAAQQRFVTAPRAERWPQHFTDDARAAVDRAAEEARRLGHSYLGTEHLLLGVIAEGRGPAEQVLRRFGVDHATVDARIAEIIGPGEGAAPACLGMTPRTKRVLEAARREARRLDHRFARPEHLLLALVAEGEGVGARILGERGADEEAVRRELAALLEREAPELAEKLRQPRRRLRRRTRGRRTVPGG